MKTLEQIRSTLPSYPIEVTFPDIRIWKHSRSGIDYVHTLESGLPGPHVMIMSLIHGNEVSGAIAVDALLAMGLKPAKGRISLGFANVDAYHRFDPANPDATRYVDEDMNRVWSEDKLNGPGDSSELRRARALRPLIDTVDFLFDIHSMHEESLPLMMCGALEKGRRFAAKIGVPEHVVIDSGHANGKRLRDYSAFNEVGKNALLIETGHHFSKRSVAIALDAASRFLIQTGVAAQYDLAHFLTQVPPTQQRFLKVTESVIAESLDFEFSQDFRGLETIPHSGTVIARDGEKSILAPYDNCVVVQPSLRHIGPAVTVARLAYPVP